MRFGAVPYQDWARAYQGRVRYDLSNSGMPEIDLRAYAAASAAVLEPGPGPHAPAPLALLADSYGLPESAFCAVGGASAAIFVVCATLLSPNDAAIVETPCYEPVALVPQALGARVARLERAFEAGYAIDWEGLDALVAAHRPRLLALTHLHNPSGVALDDGALDRLARLAEREDLHVFLNTVYADATLGPALCLAARSPRFIVGSSLTKVYGLGSLRYGWVACTDAAVALALRHTHDHIMVGHARPSEAFAEQAIRDRERLRGALHARAREGMPLVERWVSETRGVSWVPPHAGILAFPRLPDGIDTLALSDLLRTEYETLVSPGEFFGAPGHVRIGVARGPEVVREGLSRLTAALERTRSRAPRSSQPAASARRVQ